MDTNELREIARQMVEGKSLISHSVIEKIREAADEIDKLRIENERLQNLANFARHDRDCWCFDGYDCSCGFNAAAIGKR